MNQNTEFTPLVISNRDNLFETTIKNFINENKVDIQNLNHKSLEAYQYMNLRHALESATMMNIRAFETWCDLLDLDYELKVTRKES